MSIKVLTNGRVLTALVMLSIFVIMSALALGFPAKARLMPLMVGVPAALLALAQFIMEYRTVARSLASSHGGPQADPSEKKGDGKKEERKMLLWTTVFFIGLLCFGFVYASPVLVFLFLYFGSRESLKLSLISAASIWLVLYLIFIVWFQIPLFKGLVPLWLLG